MKTRGRRIGISIPREAGLEAGKAIAEDCKADPNELLFAIVDKHVRRVAEKAPALPRSDSSMV